MMDHSDENLCLPTYSTAPPRLLTQASLLGNEFVFTQHSPLKILVKFTPFTEESKSGLRKS